MSKLGKKKVTHKGKEYSSHSALAREFGITPSTLMCRLYRGYSLEDALSTDFDKKSRKNSVVHTIEGDKYTSLKQLAEDMFIKPTTLQARLRGGYTLEQAIDPDFYAKYDKRKNRDVFGNSRLTDIAKTNKINPETLRHRLKRGYTLEQATDPDFKSKYAWKKNNDYKNCG